MKAIRFISVFLVLALIFGCFVSCDAEEIDPAKLLENATNATSNAPYAIEMDMSFSTSNTKYKSTLENMSIDGMKVYVDGKNINMSMDADVSGVKTNMEYTVFNRVMYVNMSISGYGQKQTIKKKANMTAEEVKEFLGDNGVDSEISVSDFTEYSMAKEGDVYIITCAGVTDDIKEVMLDKVSGLVNGAEIEVDDVTYRVKIADGKYDGVYLYCDYVMTVGSETVEFTMKITLEFDYDEEVKISVPDDADEYDEVEYSEISGK